MTLGEAIKFGRDYNNLSRRRLADMMHIEERTLKKYEEGSISNPDKRLVNEIFYALDMLPPFDEEGNIVFPLKKKDGTELTDKNGISEVTDKNGTYEIPDDKPKKIMKLGTCVYCGQQVMIECDEDTDLNEVNAEVTWNCNCETAQAARRKKLEEEDRARERIRRIDAAVWDITNLIADQGHPEASMLLCKAVPFLIDGQMDKITIRINSRLTATVLVTSQGKIQVERRVVNVDQAESE